MDFRIGLSCHVNYQNLQWYVPLYGNDKLLGSVLAGCMGGSCRQRSKLNQKGQEN